VLPFASRLRGRSGHLRVHAGRCRFGIRFVFRAVAGFCSHHSQSCAGRKVFRPDTAVSDTSSFTPDPTHGVSWSVQFATDLKGSGMLATALQHHYVWACRTTPRRLKPSTICCRVPGTTQRKSARSPRTVTARRSFHPYPFVYDKVLAPLVSLGVPYRMTEANDCLHGVPGASNGFASALWSLDYMHWWPGITWPGSTFTTTPGSHRHDRSRSAPCTAQGCANYRVTPKAYGIKAFDLGSHGYVEQLSSPTRKRST